jgi:hypothetical protein
MNTTLFRSAFMGGHAGGGGENYSASLAGATAATQVIAVLLPRRTASF